jgi:SAM-dependent methyltransferase
VLDVGAGPVSIFEHVAPASADVTAHDTLAEEYNTLVAGKQFPIVSIIPDRRFDIVALLNCLDHMDAPAELLAHVAPRLAPDGAAWVYCNVDQPYDPALHPQDFRFWQLIALVGGHFDIERCGLTREGRLFPYAWWAICRARRPGGSLRRLRRRWWFTAQCGAQYAWFHTVRAGIKLVKLAGGRGLLPEELRF